MRRCADSCCSLPSSRVSSGSRRRPWPTPTRPSRRGPASPTPTVATSTKWVSSWTKDGVLHVLWRKQALPGQEEIRHTPISTTGAVGATTTASNGFASGNPRLSCCPTAACGSSSAGSRDRPAAATACRARSHRPAREASLWTLTGARVSSTQSAITEGVGAAVKPDGTPAFTYAYSFVVGYHMGLELGRDRPRPAARHEVLRLLAQRGVRGQWQRLRRWYSRTWKARSARTCSRSPRRSAPRSWRRSRRPTARRSRVAAHADRGARRAAPPTSCTRSGYPTCTRVLVWKVGTTTPVEIATGEDIEAVTMSSDSRRATLGAVGRRGRALALRVAHR